MIASNTGAHYGHISRVSVRPNGVVMEDQKDGSMRNDIYAMTDPSKRQEKAELLKGRSVTFPNKLDTDAWHALVVETVGDQMRAHHRRQAGRGVSEIFGDRPPDQIQSRIRVRWQRRLFR